MRLHPISLFFLSNLIAAHVVPLNLKRAEDNVTEGENGPGWIKICKDPDYKRCMTYNALNKCINMNKYNGDFNDQISSVTTASNNTACFLFQDIDCSARSSPSRALENKGIPDLKSINFDGATSSFTCWEQASGGVSDSPHRKRAMEKRRTIKPFVGDLGMILLCPDDDFKGACGPYKAMETCVNLDEWRGVLNKKVSSANPSAYTACTLYSEFNCQGPSYHFDRPVFKLRPFGWNDRASSFKCYDNRYGEHNTQPGAPNIPSKRSWGRIHMERTNGAVGEADLCLDINYRKCTRFSARDKCVNLEAPQLKSAMSIRLAENTECQFYDNTDCNGEDLRSWLDMNWKNLDKGPTRKWKWEKKIASLICWDSTH